MFVPHVQRRGATPRRVAVERKKKLYAGQDIGALLAAQGYDPVRHDAHVGSLDAGKGALVGRLPLSAFDDREMEIYEPEDWITRGRGGATSGAARIPARALQRTAGAAEWARCVVTGVEAGAWGGGSL